MALEELTTQVEKFVDKCTLSGFVKPHPADAARLQAAGVVINPEVLAEAKEAAKTESVAEPAEEVLSQDTFAEVSSQDILSQGVEGSESQKKRRKKHRHHHEE